MKKQKSSHFMPIRKYRLHEACLTFFVCTTLICLLEGILGTIFLPEEPLFYDAFFSPPLFGAISAVLDFLINGLDKKNPSQAVLILRQFLFLALVEAAVFGLNHLSGHTFDRALSVALMLSVAAVFSLVHLILYSMDKRRAQDFNLELKKLQESEGSSR